MELRSFDDEIAYRQTKQHFFKLEKQAKRLPVILLGVPLLFLLFYGIYLYINDKPQNLSADGLTQSSSIQSEEISIAGEVGDIVSSRAFTLYTPGLFDGELLIISKHSLAEGIKGDKEVFVPHQIVNITGTVESFNAEILGQRLGMDLTHKRFENWEGRSVLIAENISPTR